MNEDVYSFLISMKNQTKCIDFNFNSTIGIRYSAEIGDLECN